VQAIAKARMRHPWADRIEAMADASVRRALAKRGVRKDTHLGVPPATTSTTPKRMQAYDALAAHAASIRAKEPGLSHERSMARAYAERPELVAQYRAAPVTRSVSTLEKAVASANYTAAAATTVAKARSAA
jgi:hypothetical protein